ncbi:Phospholipase/carboxylesterase/thioesterase [Crepidotus variabilis]|uniref:Acyl-protein thioesterase 1 n=1 Tax=Crepidotus variabilis TaxID=179855 RepID=A0A9P6ESX1_9AGAR|nr:Phospholipase/carboxylesterase/thioesterase [Crepidotus variabilis]
MTPAPIILEAVTKQTATVIVVHGLGDTGMGWKPIAQMFTSDPALQHVKWVLPTAPTRSISVNGGLRMPSWFDMSSFEDFSEDEDEAGMTQSTETLRSIIKSEIDHGTPANRIVLSGFSQGGAMSLLTGLTGEEKLAGIVSLSGWLPLLKKFQDKSLLKVYVLTTPVFMSHGGSDPLVPPPLSKDSFKTLTDVLKMEVGEKGACKGVAHTVYRGVGHTTTPEILNDFKTFIKAAVPAYNEECT